MFTYLSTKLNGFRTNQRGAAAVEFSLVAPVFVLLLFGMISYGIYFGAAHSVQEIASDAARVAIAGLDADERQDMVSRYIAANADDYLFIDSNRVSFTVGTGDKDPSELLVSVSYDAAALPIWNLLPRVALPSSMIARKVSIRLGGL